MSAASKDHQSTSVAKKSLLEQTKGDAIMLRGPSFLKKPTARRSASPAATTTPAPLSADALQPPSPTPSQQVQQQAQQQSSQQRLGTPPLSPTVAPAINSSRGKSAQARSATSPPPAPALQREGTPQLQHQPTMLTTGPKLIPSPKEGCNKRYTVVLDLDETVVYARDGPLYARAHLKDLLRTMNKYCEVIVWTAGERAYAKAIMKEINCESVIQHLVYRHRKWFDPKDYTKDLSLLGRDMNYVLIIENTPDCVRDNPQNGIIVEDFEGITNEDLDKSTHEAPGLSIGAESKAARDDADADANNIIIDDASGSAGGMGSQVTFGDAGGGEASESASPQLQQHLQHQHHQQQQAAGSSAVVEKPKRKRKAKDNTLLYLMEIIEALGNSGGETVPNFLASCALLKRQIVLCNDHGKSREVPIYYLPSKRRPAGSELKVVKLNRDRQVATAEPIGHLPARLISPPGTVTVAAANASQAAAPDGAEESKRKRGGSAPSTPPPSPTAGAKRRSAAAVAPLPEAVSATAPSSLPRSPKSAAQPLFPAEPPAPEDGGADALSKKRAKKE